MNTSLYEQNDFLLNQLYNFAAAEVETEEQSILSVTFFCRTFICG